MSKNEHITIILESVIIIFALILIALVFSYFKYEKPAFRNRNNIQKNDSMYFPNDNKYIIEDSNK